METVKTNYLGSLRTEAEHVASGTKIITDAPADNHGKGEYFSPTDLLAASYSSCVLTIIGVAAQNHGFNIDGAEAKTKKIMGTDPRRVVELQVDYTFPHNNYNDKERKIIELAVKQCPVANSLDPALKITKTITYKD
ncbi:MAG: OsmC family protein [Bacteroidales bacterium]|nr:OsmC family protein [Bacteroidales bacterium]